MHFLHALMIVAGCWALGALLVSPLVGYAIRRMGGPDDPLQGR